MAAQSHAWCCLARIPLILYLLAITAHAQPNTPAVEISGQPGCGMGDYLKPNMQDCAVDEIMGSNGTLAFTFSVDSSGANYSVLLTLRSVGGSAIMRLLDSGSSTPLIGQVVYFNDAVTESFLRVPASQLTPGQYTVVVQGLGGATQKMLLYLRVQTPPPNVRLAAADKAVIQTIQKECCPAAGNPNAPAVCTSFLPSVLNAKSVDDDLCHQAAFVCDEDGHLTKIDFSNAGLQCKSFPAAIGKLPQLETLMMRYNSFGGATMDDVASVLSDSPAIRRLMLGATNLTGTVPCSLFDDHELRTVMISVNKLEGSLPECVLASPTLEELYMSMLTLTGPLPDTLPTDSNLRVWYAINSDPVTGETAGPGFEGEIPPSIGNAAGLAFIELSGHQLTGGVPVLPEGMRMFEAQGNNLDGGIASPLPAGLVYFDVENNSLTGPLPDFTQAADLVLLDVSGNQLTQALPESLGAAGYNLQYFDLSGNRLSGNINAGDVWDRLPGLRYCMLNDNGFEGTVPASLAAYTNLVYLNLANNSLSGDLQAFAEAITSAPKVSPQKAGRKLFSKQLQQQGSHISAHSTPSPLLARKLFGSYETYTPATLAGWHLNPQNILALGSGNIAAARRGLQQQQATAAQQSESPVQAEVPAAGRGTASVAGPPPDTQQDPAAEVQTQKPTLPSPATQSTATAAVQQAGATTANDIGTIDVPSRSQLAGNGLLYLNISNNMLEGPIPEVLGNLEMFRSPANSTDPYDMFVYNRGGLDRVLDLTNNALYGQFPLFLVKLPDGLADACMCKTTFNVSQGNILYCPTKQNLGKYKAPALDLAVLQDMGYTCQLPNKAQPVLLSQYLSNPADWITAVPDNKGTVVEGTPRFYQQTRAANAASSSSSGSDRNLGPGAIAGIVIGSVAGAAIIASLAYLVGYKRFYQVHKATSFEKNQIPDGPGLGG